MNLTYIQLAGFASEWRRYHLEDVDLMALEQQLHDNPAAGQVMRGTGGLRKIRFAPPSGHSGKSGAYRVGYAYFPIGSTIYLMAIFPKKDRDNLSAAECAAFKASIQWLSKSHRGSPPKE